MNDKRPAPLSGLLLMARLAVLAGIVAGISGAARAIADGIETGMWDPERLVLWLALGLLPIGGGWTTGRLLRGPGNQGLVAVATVTLLLGAAVVTLWVLEGLGRRG